MIPALPYPFCLTDVIPHNVISNSRDFVTVINKGFLSLVAPKTAEDLLSDPDTQQVIRREMKKIEVSAGQLERMDKFEAEKDTAREQIAIKESPDVSNIVYKHKNGEMTAQDLLLELKARSHVITAADLNFVLANVDAGRVQDWCQKTLAGMQDKRAARLDDNLNIQTRMV